MKKEYIKLVDELIQKTIDIKKNQFAFINDQSSKHNEKIALYILYNTLDQKGMPLSYFREKMNLAPSTITPVITSLEEKGFIERIIDKNDRRNIFLQITPKGVEYAQKAYEDMQNNMMDFMEYLGKEDSKKMIELLDKSIKYFKERGSKC